MLPTTRLAILIMASAIFHLTAEAAASTVEVEVHHTAQFHVFPPGESFSFDIIATVVSGPAPEGLGYQWRDFHGSPLGPAVPLADGVRATVTSPSDSPKVGYYGLAFLPEDPDVTFNENTGSRREIGFAVLSSRTASDRALNPASPFGVVHADLDDPYLPTWIKTMTWHTSRSHWWSVEMQRRRDKGLLELPLISGDRWTSDDAVPVSSHFIKALKNEIRRYFKADPAVSHWELGREENLRSRFDQPRYFANLKAKVAAVREVAMDVSPKIRFLYQVAGRSLTDVKKFLASEAADEFDILAPHPYVWPDFPAPEEWLEAFIDTRRSAMQQAGRNMPMWFTEIGAPQNDARVPQMLSGKEPVRGQPRDENAAYIVKVHILAFARGIEKIFWYNYRDGASSTTDVEDHFGMIDHWGFPKPAYSAYVTLVQCVEGKDFQENRALPGGILIYEFGAGHESCLVAWVYPASKQMISLSAVRPGLTKDNLVALTNTVGAPLQVSAAITLSEFPVFVTASNETAPGVQ